VQALPAGARVVGPERDYAWTRSLLAKVDHVTVDTSDTEATLRASEGADLLWLESPSNPLLEVADLERLCEAGVPVAVDSTRRFSSARWSSVPPFRCIVHPSSSAATPTSCSAW
jgi:cystathionine gamma-synthase